MTWKVSKLNHEVEASGQDSSHSSQNLGQTLGPPLALFGGMAGSPILAVCHVQASGRSIPVFLSRNEGGSVAGRCVLDGGDTPIIDGSSTEEVLRLLQDAIEGLLMARLARTT